MKSKTAIEAKAIIEDIESCKRDLRNLNEINIKGNSPVSIVWEFESLSLSCINNQEFKEALKYILDSKLKNLKLKLEKL